MTNKIVMIFVVVFCVTSTPAQDSLKLESELAIEIKGQHVLRALYEDQNFATIPSGSFVSDNPFHHFAIYSGVNYKGTLNDRYTFETGLYMEERSFSGGSNTVKNWVLFPRIKISAIDTLKLGKTELKMDVSAGDFWNEDFSDILRFYNMDFQAVQAEFGIGKLWLGVSVIGDLSRNIGFDLHELYKFSLRYQSDDFLNVSSYSINELLSGARGNHLTKQDVNVANYSRWNINENTALELQADIRINNKLGTFHALGIKVKHKVDNFSIKSTIRYYQENFNDGYLSNKPNFRVRQSYVGEQLYPLKNYYRDINQWGLITQYGNTNILNFELGFNWDKNVYKKLFFMSELDFNLIHEIRDIDFYPFYNVGLKMKFHEKFVFFVSGTNKHMNLDTFYQTSYASELPFLSYGFKMKLDKINLGTKYL